MPTYMFPASDGCNAHGLSRRAWIQAGFAGGLSTLAAPGRAARGEAPPLDGLGLPGFGKAKRCIFLFMWGGPSQLDTFDPKPLAPAEVRGSFGVIDTNVPGIQFSEHFHRLAQHADKLAVIRSMTHDDPAHLSSAHTILTGNLPPVNKSDAVPPSDRDTPHLGSVISHLRPSAGSMPAAVTMPWITSHPAAPGGKAPGQHAGWLGHRHDPMLVTGDPNDPKWQVPALALMGGQSVEHLSNRRRLLESLDRQAAAVSTLADCREFTGQQARAFDLLTSPDVRTAFDLGAETPETRDRYGRNIHGQCVLMARRLVERGVQVVSVNWHDDGRNFWDTHGDNFNRLKNDLIPPSDQALSALLTDLHRSGLLDETLVVWTGEFGRNPTITAANAGREHHPWCYSSLLAGGGVRGGQVYGSSDRHAAHPTENPVTPQDFSATVYHALGIPADHPLHDTLGRPHPVTRGRPVTELF